MRHALQAEKSGPSTYWDDKDLASVGVKAKDFPDTKGRAFNAYKNRSKGLTEQLKHRAAKRHGPDLPADTM